MAEQETKEVLNEVVEDSTNTSSVDGNAEDTKSTETSEPAIEKLTFVKLPKLPHTLSHLYLLHSDCVWILYGFKTHLKSLGSPSVWVVFHLHLSYQFLNLFFLGGVVLQVVCGTNG